MALAGHQLVPECCLGLIFLNEGMYSRESKKMGPTKNTSRDQGKEDDSVQAAVLSDKSEVRIGIKLAITI